MEILLFINSDNFSEMLRMYIALTIINDTHTHTPTQPHTYYTLGAKIRLSPSSTIQRPATEFACRFCLSASIAWGFHSQAYSSFARALLKIVQTQYEYILI